MLSGRVAPKTPNASCPHLGRMLARRVEVLLLPLGSECLRDAAVAVRPLRKQKSEKSEASEKSESSESSEERRVKREEREAGGETEERDERESVERRAKREERREKKYRHQLPPRQPATHHVARGATPSDKVDLELPELRDLGEPVMPDLEFHPSHGG